MGQEYNLPELPEYKLKPGDPEYNAFLDEDSPFFGLSPDWSPRPSRPIPTVRCGRTKNNGEPCRNRAVRGSGISGGGMGLCAKHGGKAPNVAKHSEAIVAAARLSLIDSLPEAVRVVYNLAIDDETPAQVRLNAAKDIMDRAGVKGGADIQVDVNVGEKPSVKLFEKLGELRADKPLEDLGEVDEPEPEKE